MYQKHRTLNSTVRTFFFFQTLSAVKNLLVCTTNYLARLKEPKLYSLQRRIERHNNIKVQNWHLHDTKSRLTLKYHNRIK